jgi:hypothetical protein
MNKSVFPRGSLELLARSNPIIYEHKKPRDAALRL